MLNEFKSVSILLQQPFIISFEALPGVLGKKGTREQKQFKTILGIKKLRTREQGPSPGRASLLYSQMLNKVVAVCHTLSTLFGMHVRTIGLSMTYRPYQEKMRGQRGRLRLLSGICYVNESYF